MSHQAYGPRTGLPRLLRLLDANMVKATFFVPGYTAERWPAAVRAIRDAGHEIAHHGYLHEGARSLTPEQQETALLRGLDALDRVAGVRPTGYRAPMWESSPETPALLVRHGFAYDSGLMDADHPYLLADRPRAGRAAPGRAAVHWSLDDWEPYVYLPGLSGSGVIARPADVVARWADELEALTIEGGLFMLTNHPFVSGRPSRAAALGELIREARVTDGMWIATAGEIAAHVATLPLTPVHHPRPRAAAGTR